MEGLGRPAATGYPKPAGPRAGGARTTDKPHPWIKAKGTRTPDPYKEIHEAHRSGEASMFGTDTNDHPRDGNGSDRTDRNRYRRITFGQTGKQRTTRNTRQDRTARLPHRATPNAPPPRGMVAGRPGPARTRRSGDDGCLFASSDDCRRSGSASRSDSDESLSTAAQLGQDCNDFTPEPATRMSAHIGRWGRRAPASL